jgi:hypothetical protein
MRDRPTRTCTSVRRLSTGDARGLDVVDENGALACLTRDTLVSAANIVGGRMVATVRERAGRARAGLN